MREKTKIFKTIILICTLSELRGVVSTSSECWPENPNENLGQGLVVYDCFHNQFKKFIDDKINSGSRWIYKKNIEKQENQFMDSISTQQYAFLEILYALSSPETTIANDLIEFFINSYWSKRSSDEFRSLQLRRVKDNINVSLDIMYNISKSVVHANEIGLRAIPHELKNEIFSIMNKSSIFIRASERGDIDIMTSLLKSTSESDQKQAFLKAYLNEQYDVLKFLIKNNVTIEGKFDRAGNIHYDKILQMAAESHNPKLLKTLIEIGVDVNKVDVNGFFPLHKAVKSDDLEIAKLLIKHGARVNSATPSGNTALHIAASNANLDIVNLLLDSGSSVDSKNRFGATAIMISEKYTILEIIHYIVSNRLITLDENNSDLNHLHHLVFRTESENLYKEQAIDFTLLSKHSKIVRTIYNKGGKLFFNDHIKAKLLGILFRKGLTCLAESLLNIGAQLDPESSETKEDFITAIKTGNKELVKLMVTEGMSVNMKLEDGTTALHVAAANKNWDIFEFLTKKMGGDINVITSDGQTLLHSAALGGDASVIKYLLDRGLSINAKDNFGLTPLATAIKANQSDIVQILNAQDSYLISKSSFGQTDLHDAAANGNEDIMASLLDSEADLEASTIDGYTPLLRAAENGQASAVRFLINKGAFIDTRRVNDGNNALHIAAEKGHLAVVQVLLEEKSPIDSVNRQSLTALHLAAKNNQIDIVKLLIDKGANIDSQEDYNQTPLHYAAGTGSVDMVNLLLSKHCKVNVINIKGYNPMDIAAQKCDKNIVYILKQYGGKLNMSIDVNCVL